MFGSKEQTGKDVIDGAVKLFTNAQDALSQGIEISKQESIKVQEEMAKLAIELEDINSSRTKAESIKTNIAALLK